MNHTFCELYNKYTILSKYEQNAHFIQQLLVCVLFHCFGMLQVSENEISVRNSSGIPGYLSPLDGTLLTIIGVRGGGSAAPPVLKNFRENPVFRASASCSKILNDKKYRFTAVNSGQAQVAKKSWLMKNVYIQYSEFRANSVFRASARC